MKDLLIEPRSRASKKAALALTASEREREREREKLGTKDSSHVALRSHEQVHELGSIWIKT